MKKRRWGQDQDVNVNVKGQVITRTQNPELNPFVSIERIARIEGAATTSSTKKDQLKVNSATELSCWLCGEASLTLLTSNYQGRRLYFKQVELFKGYLHGRNHYDREIMGDRVVETCDTCLQEVKQVWDLNQQIVRIQEKISKIIDRVAISMPKAKASENRKQEVVKIGRKCEDRYGTRISPKTRPVKKTRFKKPRNSRHRESKSRPASENGDPTFDLNLLDLEIKEEIPWSEDEESNLNIPDDQSCFEMMAINPQQGQEESDSEQNIPGQVNPEPELLSPTSGPSLRPKRQSRLVAEEILRRTIPSEVKTEPVGSDDGHGEQSENEIDADPAIPDPAESNSDSEKLDLSDSDSNHRQKTKRRKPDKTPTPCPNCGKVLKGLHNLQEHIRRVHDRILPHKCQYCEKFYGSASDLKKHIRWNHTREVFKCSVCSKELASKKRWAIHEATVCQVKGQGWGPERLKNEFGIVLLLCPIPDCGKLLDRPSELKRHLLSHTDSTGPRPFICSLCHPIRSFAKANNLKRHNLEIHPKNEDGVPTSVNAHKILCHLCGASMLPVQLKLHIARVHEGVRNFGCTQCDKRFFSSYGRARHVATVHDGATSANSVVPIQQVIAK